MEFELDPEHLSDEPPLEGPSIPITILMAKKVISKMKFSKAVGPSGVVVEMNRAAVDTDATIIRVLRYSFEMRRSQLTWSRASLSAFTREMVICSGPRQLLRTEIDGAGYESH